MLSTILLQWNSVRSTNSEIAHKFQVVKMLWDASEEFSKRQNSSLFKLNECFHVKQKIITYKQKTVLFLSFYDRINYTSFFSPGDDVQVMVSKC